MPTCPYTWEICDSDGEAQVTVEMEITYSIEPIMPASHTAPEEGGGCEVRDWRLVRIDMNGQPDPWDHWIFNRHLLKDNIAICTLWLLFAQSHDLESICREHAAEQERQMPQNRWEARGDV